MNDQDLRELFREMRDEPVPPDSLRRVRVAVAERTKPRALPWWRRPALAAAASVAALIALMFYPRATPVAPQAPRITRPVVVKAQPAPPVSRPVLKTRRAPVRRVAPVVERDAVADMVIRIETADPDVVILLLD